MVFVGSPSNEFKFLTKQSLKMLLVFLLKLETNASAKLNADEKAKHQQSTKIDPHEFK